jgi:hypothetical protein
VALLLGGVLSACGDDPFQVDWTVNPDTVLLYSLERPELNLPSAFNFDRRTTIRVEAPTATGAWDLAVDTREGSLVFLPPGALGIESEAAIVPLAGIDFDELTEAPADTAVYVRDEAVPVETGTVYVVRTNRVASGFGRRCVFYAKMEPLEVDGAEGSVRFVFDSSPVCNDRDLVPPD